MRVVWRSGERGAAAGDILLEYAFAKVALLALKVVLMVGKMLL